MNCFANVLHMAGPTSGLDLLLCPPGVVVISVISGLLISGRRMPPIIILAILAASMGIGIFSVWSGERRRVRSLSPPSR